MAEDEIQGVAEIATEADRNEDTPTAVTEQVVESETGTVTETMSEAVTYIITDVEIETDVETEKETEEETAVVADEVVETDVDKNAEIEGVRDGVTGPFEARPEGEALAVSDRVPKLLIEGAGDDMTEEVVVRLMEGVVDWDVFEGATQDSPLVVTGDPADVKLKHSEEKHKPHITHTSFTRA